MYAGLGHASLFIQTLSRLDRLQMLNTGILVVFRLFTVPSTAMTHGDQHHRA
jgi:hypothetical protein